MENKKLENMYIYLGEDFQSQSENGEGSHYLPITTYSYSADYNISNDDINNPDATFYYSNMFFARIVDHNSPKIFEAFRAKKLFPKIEIIFKENESSNEVFRITLLNCKICNISYSGYTGMNDETGNTENISIVYTSIHLNYGEKTEPVPGENRGPKM